MKQGGNKGLTLVEILIALSILAVISLSVYATLAAATKLKIKGTQNLMLQREAVMAVEHMTRDLENMIPYEIFFADHVSIILIIPTGQGLKVVRYALESQTLIRQETSLQHYLNDGFDGASTEVLSQHVSDSGFHLYYAGTQERPWQESWDEKTLPRGVRIDLTLSAQSPRSQFHIVRDVFIPAGSLGEL